MGPELADVYGVERCLVCPLIVSLALRASGSREVGPLITHHQESSKASRGYLLLLLPAWPEREADNQQSFALLGISNGRATPINSQNFVQHTEKWRSL